MKILIVAMLAMVLAAESVAPAQSVSTAQVLEAERSAAWDQDKRTQRLVELGADAAPTICQAYAPGEISISALKAVARLGNPAANENLMVHFRAFRRQDKPKESWYIECIRALRHCRAREAVEDLAEIMRDGLEIRDSRSDTLSLSLEAAAGVVSLGDEKQKAEARDFILTIMREVPVGMECIVSYSLLIAVSLCGSEDGLDYVARYITREYWMEEEFYLSLPRDTGHIGLMKAVHLQLTEHALQVGMQPLCQMAALEALSEMKSVSEVVPAEFWQQYWDEWRLELVRYASTGDYPSSITWEMLNARHKAWLQRMGVQWDHGDVTRRPRDG